MRRRAGGEQPRRRNNKGDQYNIGLKFTEGLLAENASALYQNRPNPFDRSTVIGFKLAEKSQARISIFDVTGKVLKVYEAEYDKGYNELILNRKDLSASGVLYYQLDTDDFTATKKMILVQ